MEGIISSTIDLNTSMYSDAVILLATGVHALPERILQAQPRHLETLHSKLERLSGDRAE